MFDNVFNDKQWKTARDAAGLKGGLTEKVSMGDEFKRFQQDKTLSAAKILQQKIALYEKQLKEKHAKEKYYAKLLKVVQDQKAAIEGGIAEAERPVDKGGKVMSDADMDQLTDEVVAREKEHWAEYENTNNDPNAPGMGEAKRVYLKLTKEFPTVEGQIKTETTMITELLQKCKALETNPNLQAKPEAAAGVAEKILETITKIEVKSSDLRTDFVTEAAIVRKKEEGETNATKALDGLSARLNEEMRKIEDLAHACRLSVKQTLQGLGNHPKVQELLGQLHV